MRLTTRLRILDYLRKQKSASVHELSHSLAMTGANIRHHLAVLESNNLIEFISQRREGRGRPVNIYGLSRRVLGDGLDELVRAMFAVWLKTATDEEREAGLRSVALRLGGENPPDLGILLPRRLTQAVERLKELHYQARWEAGMDGPHVILGHCPYAVIIASYPELCRIDAFFLEQQSGVLVEQIARLKPSIKGYPYCAFRVIGDRGKKLKG
jgi:predicted ArsR family transcriptional regulator